MLDESSQKIWKYMDLAKFISLLSKGALYFACPSEFNDPFEGYFPMSWLQDNYDYKNKLEKHINGLNETRRNVIADNSKFNEQINKTTDDAINNIKVSLDEEIKERISEHGVNCWHKSEYESEAMWKLYSASGQGIAIESTIGQLKDSITNEESLKIESIWYFENESKKEQDKAYDTIFMKRKAFEHEKELRASILLKEKGKGIFVECNLDRLINRIHVSPLVEPYFKDIVNMICGGEIRNINKPVIPSTLFDKPDTWNGC